MDHEEAHSRELNLFARHTYVLSLCHTHTDTHTLPCRVGSGSRQVVCLYVQPPALRPFTVRHMQPLSHHVLRTRPRAAPLARWPWTCTRASGAERLPRMYVGKISDHWSPFHRLFVYVCVCMHVQAAVPPCVVSPLAARLSPKAQLCANVLEQQIS